MGPSGFYFRSIVFGVIAVPPFIAPTVVECELLSRVVIVRLGLSVHDAWWLRSAHTVLHENLPPCPDPFHNPRAPQAYYFETNRATVLLPPGSTWPPRGGVTPSGASAMALSGSRPASRRFQDIQATELAIHWQPCIYFPVDRRGSEPQYICPINLGRLQMRCAAVLSRLFVGTTILRC